MLLCSTLIWALFIFKVPQQFTRSQWFLGTFCFFDTSKGFRNIFNTILFETIFVLLAIVIDSAGSAYFFHLEKDW
jgi:hypothetical protein